MNGSGPLMAPPTDNNEKSPRRREATGGSVCNSVQRLVGGQEVREPGAGVSAAIPTAIAVADNGFTLVEWLMIAGAFLAGAERLGYRAYVFHDQISLTEQSACSC